MMGRELNLFVYVKYVNSQLEPGTSVSYPFVL
jgi:hypothetical protein